MAVLAYMNKIKLTSTASELLKLFRGDEDMDKLTTKSLRNNFSNIQPSIRHIYYCSNCGAHFPAEEDVYTCLTGGCDVLWYAGPRNIAASEKKKMLFCHSASPSAASRSTSKR